MVNGWRDTDTDWHSDTESYSYDGLDRLTSASCTPWSHTYSYDKAGNRTAKDGVTYTINTVNEVTALSDGTSFTYDSNGNRTQKTKGTDTWTYTYDHANRLTKVEENSSTVGEYVYNGDGWRIQVTESSVTTTYTYSGLNVLYEENSAGIATYIYGPEGRLAKRTTVNQETNTFYYHNDHLGSTRLVTDDSRNIISAVTYHPFGESSTEEGSEDNLFTGKERDSTDLYYYGARYYDPRTGRFLTRDIARGNYKSPQSLNRYSYCRSNPLSYLDPDGRIEKRFVKDSPGSSGPPSGSNSWYGYTLMGHIAEVNLYALESSDDSELLIVVLITFDVKKTEPESSRNERGEVTCFSIAIEGDEIGDIESAIVNILAEEGINIGPTFGSEIIEDHINALWAMSEGEAGKHIYVYVSITVTSSGGTEVRVVISTETNNCDDPVPERSVVFIIPLSGDPDGDTETADIEIV